MQELSKADIIIASEIKKTKTGRKSYGYNKRYCQRVRLFRQHAKFNFVPNNNAKHLKQNNSKAIGVLVKGISNMLFASVVEEIQRMIEKTEYTLVVSYLDEDADEVEQAILLCRERKPLGIFTGSSPVWMCRVCW